LVKDHELAQAEQLVNAEIRANWPILTEILNFDDAVRSGATALFEERYGESVRVVTMGQSRELCGGTHAQRTGDIGFFLITQETAVSAGVRRLECLTGAAAVTEFQTQRGHLNDLSQFLKIKPDNLLARVQKLAADLKQSAKTPKPQSDGSAKNVNAVNSEHIGNIKLFTGEVLADNPKNLREIGDFFRQKLGPRSVLALGAKSSDQKALLLVLVSEDLKDLCPAGRLIGPMAEAVGGRGGGKPLLAQAGGPHGQDLAKAFLKVKEEILKCLK
jgi:alanyl-tRNA synthetase